MSSQDNTLEQIRLTDEEIRLVRRVRQLTSGAHTLILFIDRVGLYQLLHQSQAKIEKVRKIPSNKPLKI